MDTKFTFTTPIKYQDGSAISSIALSNLTYEVLVDTVTPPVKAYPVPTANLTSATSNPDGSKTVTVLFTDIGFTPAANMTYFATASDALGALSSGDANIVSFTNVVAPAPPSAFGVA